jgi:hypothetical protein
MSAAITGSSIQVATVIGRLAVRVVVMLGAIFVFSFSFQRVVVAFTR